MSLIAKEIHRKGQRSKANTLESSVRNEIKFGVT